MRGADASRGLWLLPNAHKTFLRIRKASFFTNSVWQYNRHHFSTKTFIALPSLFRYKIVNHPSLPQKIIQVLLDRLKNCRIQECTIQVGLIYENQKRDQSDLSFGS